MPLHIIQDLNQHSLHEAVDLTRVPAPDRALLQALLDDSPAGALTQQAVFRTLNPNGTWQWFELQAQQLAQPHGSRPTQRMGVLTDITQRKRLAEHALLQQQFLEVQAQSPDRPTLITAMLDTVLGLSDLDGGGLYWQRADRGFELLASRGLSDDFLATARSIEPDDPRVAIIASGTMLCSCADPQLACTDPGLVQRPHIQAEGIVALVVLPITVAGRGQACLNLASRHVCQLPSASIALLQSLAEQFGLAIERLMAREDAQNQRQNLSGFFHTLQDFVFVLNEQGAIQYVNPAVYQKLGYDAGLLGQSVLAVHPQRVHASAWAIVTDMLQGKRESCPLPLLRADGSELMVDTRIVAGHWNGRPALLGISRDMSEQRTLELALQASLHEKEALLKEVHHRVKNNLQLITSLIRLEAGRSAQPEVKSVLGEMQGRIRSMALLHESLYRQESFASVDLGRYLGQLATQVFSAIRPSQTPIELRLELASVAVGLDQAIPCGLLVNELITNALKHGFADGRAGSVSVALCAKTPGWCLSVSDNGAGLPADFSARRQLSLGLQLATGLASQLGGPLQIDPPARFSVTFEVARFGPGKGSH